MGRMDRPRLLRKRIRCDVECLTVPKLPASVRMRCELRKGHAGDHRKSFSRIGFRVWSNPQTEPVPLI